MELLKQLSTKPDIIHINDWHCALIPVLLKKEKIDIKTVLTIHDMSFQGITNFEMLKLTNLDSSFFTGLTPVFWQC